MYKLFIISNNIAKPDYKAEHGLSILLTSNKKSVLLDTGHSAEFIENFERLAPDNIDYLVLSHGHYDHCGNIEYIVNRYPGIKILYHPDLLKVRYSIHPERDPQVRNIGVTENNLSSLKRVENISCSTPCRISEGIYTTGEIPRLSEEDTGGPFYLEPEGKTPDLLKDDQSIYIITENGLVVITGCCHSGLINTIEYIKKISGIDRIRGIVGGLHLSKASERRINETINYINSLKPEFVYPGHCTGDSVAKKMKKEINSRVIELEAGLTFEF